MMPMGLILPPKLPTDISTMPAIAAAREQSLSGVTLSPKKSRDASSTNTG